MSRDVLSFHKYNPVGMSLVDFMGLSIGNIVISPSGNAFIMGDPELIEEIITDEFEDCGADVKEFEFSDIGDTTRKVIFINGRAIGYDILYIDNTIVYDMTGVTEHPDDPEFSDFYEMEVGIGIDPYMFIGE